MSQPEAKSNVGLVRQALLKILLDISYFVYLISIYFFCIHLRFLCVIKHAAYQTCAHVHLKMLQNANLLESLLWKIIISKSDALLTKSRRYHFMITIHCYQKNKNTRCKNLKKMLHCFSQNYFHILAFVLCRSGRLGCVCMAVPCEVAIIKPSTGLWSFTSYKKKMCIEYMVKRD